MSYLVEVKASGDSAEAPSFRAALVAADVLCHEYADGLMTQGALRLARESVVITENGTVQGILTELARLGMTRPS